MVTRPVASRVTRPITRPVTGDGVLSGSGGAGLDIKAAVGTSTSPTSPGTKAVTGVGFQPKLLLPFGTLMTADGTSVISTLSFGAGVSATNRAVIGAASDNGVPTSATERKHSNAEIYSNPSPLSPSDYLNADLDSLDADGFTLDWTTVTTARILNHIGLGGDDLEVSVTQHALTNATADYAHGLSGEPTAVILLGSLDNVAPPNTATDINNCIGFWAGGNQIGCNLYSRNGQPTTSNRRILSNTYINQYLTAFAVWFSASVSGVDSTNVSFSFANVISGTPRYVYMIAIRGAKAQVGTFDCNGSTDPLTIACSGITPKLFLPVFVQKGVTSLNAAENSLVLSIGASDGTNNVSCGITDQNSVTTTNARRFQSSTTLCEYNTLGTKSFEATAAFSGQSVVVTPTTAAANFGQGGYLILGA